MTVFTLACDPFFDPVYVPANATYGMQRDKKPWPRARRRNLRALLRRTMLCCVCGGSPYTPTDAAGYRVCGYCRTKVVVARARMAGENAEVEAGAA